jgi:hypothetical protein
MNPILREYIEPSGMSGFELMEAISEATHTDLRQSISLHASPTYDAGIPPRKVQKDTARAKDVTQRRKGFVQFIF